MRTPQELASDVLVSPAEHARKATTLRRLAGGLRAQLAGAQSLKDQERRLLSDASDLLDRMAETSKKAAALAKTRVSNLASRERAVRAAMAGNFAALSAVADQVALIGTVNSYAVKGATPLVTDLRKLRDAYAQSVDDLVATLARRSPDKRPDAVVQQAWLQFEATKVAIQAEHGELIAALNASLRAARPR